MVDKGNKIFFTVSQAEEGMLLREFLLEIQQISRNGLCKLKNHGKILCNGEFTTVRKKLTAGDQVTLIYPQETISEYLKSEPVSLNIVFEDNDLLLVNKPAGICVHPTKGYPTGTLANGVIYYLQGKGEELGFHAVNRLDVDTSGLVLIAKNSYSKQQLFLQQQQKQLLRSYQALVQGSITWQRNTITDPIRKIDAKTTKREIHLAGQRAVTHVEVIKVYSEHTLIRLVLETGRTHQIRIHLANWGFPLVGDGLYGGSNCLMSRQALHADYMQFAHPRTADKLSFQLPLPSDMQAALEELRSI
ncbi:MAG: RluA family pseudouridine synthase [Clostridia bacterium]|nr:RluA family pseudouridine synthase [Clostridia bacterium]